MIFDTPVLSGKQVRLEPLTEEHLAGLRAAVTDGELWTLFYTSVPHPDELQTFFANASREHEAGLGQTFATIDCASGRVIGSTRFMNASLVNKRVEIGFTFIARSFQKTLINTEAKLLMLTHVFESLGLNRVEFVTDYLNTASRAAILRLGAKEEGILRNHRVMPNGRIRDSVVFSILTNEWPGVKQNLQHKLSLPRVAAN